MSCKGASAHRLGSIYSLLPRHIVSVKDGESSGSASSHCQCDGWRELRLRVSLRLKFQWGTPTTLCVDIRLSAR